MADVIDHPLDDQELGQLGQAPGRGYRASNPSRLKLCSMSRTRSGLVKVTLAMAGPSMPCADSNTICAHRQVTTDPELRRTMRSSRLPSSW